MQIRPFEDSFAGEVVGLDVGSEQLNEHAEELRHAIDSFGVLVVRDAGEDDEAFARFCATFGELEKPPKIMGDFSETQTREKAFAASTRLWHTDDTYRELWPRYTVLAARIVPPEGGGTEFRDMRAAYDALPDRTRAKIDPLSAIHDFARSYASAGLQISEAERVRFPALERPLVATHPTTGRRSILAGLHCDRIVDMSADEGRRLLDELDEFANQKRFCHVHLHRPGDIVMWDNRSVEHRAMPYDTNYPRLIRRAVVI